MQRLMTLLIFILVLSACAPDPRKEAEAYATRIQAEQDALNQAQERAHAEDAHVVELKELQVQQSIQAEDLRLQQQHREATAKEWEIGLNRLIHWSFIFGTITVCALAVALSYSSIGVARATVRAAEVRANLIPLDAKTRQFPLLIQHVHGDRYLAYNPNTGSVLKLDMQHEADRQLIATSGATQIAGVIAQEARQSTDPASVAIVNPPVIDVQADGVTIGRDIIRRGNE